MLLLSCRKRNNIKNDHKVESGSNCTISGWLFAGKPDVSSLKRDRRLRLILPSSAIVSVTLLSRLRNTFPLKIANATAAIVRTTAGIVESWKNCINEIVPIPIIEVDTIAIATVPALEGPDDTETAIDIVQSRAA
ncbi:MAG: hypothetical protein JWP38_2374 [Herbaspirillum sp.]|nr:hypothetical protein [Herbaspirillum sp.]